MDNHEIHIRQPCIRRRDHPYTRFLPWKKSQLPSKSMVPGFDSVSLHHSASKTIPERNKIDKQNLRTIPTFELTSINTDKSFSHASESLDEQRATDTDSIK